MIENSLKVEKANEGSFTKMFGDKLNKKIDSDFHMHEEMESKRREKEKLEAQQEIQMKELEMAQDNSIEQ